jgi:hypothetical protein
MENEILEDIKDLYVEGSFNSRWIEIETHHKIGLILNDLESDMKLEGIPSSEELCTIAKYLKKSVDFLIDCKQFAEEYPNLNETKFDKTISWSQIRKNLRPKRETRGKLTVAKVKEIVRDRKKMNEERQFGMLVFEDNEILKALDEYKPVEEAIKTEGEGE